MLCGTWTSCCSSGSDASLVNRRDGVLLLLLGAGWGAVYPLNAAALDEFPPTSVVAIRTGLAAVVLIPFLLNRGALTALRTRPVAVVVAALLQATIPLVLLTIGQEHISAGLAGILVTSQPLWVTALSAAIDRTIHFRQVVGGIICMAGVVLIFMSDLSLNGVSRWAAGAALAAAAFFAAGAVWVERVIPEVPPGATAAVAMMVSTLALAPIAATASSGSTVRLTTVGWLVLLGVIATGGALWLFYWLIHRIGAAHANLAGYLAPGFAVIYGRIFLGQQTSIEALIGLALITAGSWVATRTMASHQADGRA